MKINAKQLAAELQLLMKESPVLISMQVLRERTGRKISTRFIEKLNKVSPFYRFTVLLDRDELLGVKIPEVCLTDLSQYLCATNGQLSINWVSESSAGIEHPPIRVSSDRLEGVPISLIETFEKIGVYLKSNGKVELARNSSSSLPQVDLNTVAWWLKPFYNPDVLKLFKLSNKRITALDGDRLELTFIGWNDTRTNLPTIWRFMFHISGNETCVQVSTHLE